MNMAAESVPTIRLLMLGTGDFARPTFERLCDTGLRVVGLITQPDRPEGRKQEIVPAAIRLAAEARGVPVYQPEDVNAPAGIELVRSLGPDLLVTAAYGQILSAELLGVPTLGGINLHGSILPRYRGAAPVARAIEQGETESGVTVIRMSPRVDAGGMIAVARTPIDPDETAGELEARLAAIGAPRIVEAVAAVAAGSAVVQAQKKAKATKAPKLAKDDGRIDWSKPARAVHDLVRAMQPWPTATTLWQSAEAGKAPLRLIVHRTAVRDEPTTAEPGRVVESEAGRLVVAAGRGAVELLEIQIPGKRRMPAAEFLRGHRVYPGDRMGESPTAGPG